MMLEQLKEWLLKNKEKYVYEEEQETSFGYIISTDNILDIDKLMLEIDRFEQSFKDKKDTTAT